MEVCLREILENTNLNTKIKINCLKTGNTVYQNDVESYLVEESLYDTADVIELSIENNTLVFEVYL